ncbi:hypothetical protein FOL46_004005, partial [Perkinsus olseni]
AKARKLPGRRRRACTLDYPDFPVLWDHEDLRHLLRADQATNPHIDTLPVADEKGTGPYFRLDDLVYFRSNSSNGTVVYRAVVSNSLRDFILRDIHRLALSRSDVCALAALVLMLDSPGVSLSAVPSSMFGLYWSPLTTSWCVYAAPPDTVLCYIAEEKIPVMLSKEFVNSPSYEESRCSFCPT